MSTRALVVAMLASAVLVSCRGQEMSEPPVHLNPNMDSQPRYDPQSTSKFFEDRRTMRTPVDGTIARGTLNENEAYTEGCEDGHFAMKAPVHFTPDVLKRGQERYNIYCTPCHDKTGYGEGLVIQRGYPKPINFHEDYARHMPDGQMYSAITHGVRNMPSYAAQIPMADRWAIVAYVRALQFSQAATVEDVPADMRGSLAVETNP
jgi:cytochrome c553